LPDVRTPFSDWMPNLQQDYLKYLTKVVRQIVHHIEEAHLDWHYGESSVNMGDETNRVFCVCKYVNLYFGYSLVNKMGVLMNLCWFFGSPLLQSYEVCHE
jgi:hypothetical protein